jgi:hypothetical protein
MEYMTARELETQYLICRSIGHAWDELPNADFSAELWRTSKGALALRCARCYAERYDYIGSDLSVVARRYKYPKNYQTIQGDDWRRPAMRFELFRRSLLVHPYTRRAATSDTKASVNGKTAPLVATRKGRARNGN